MRREVMAAHKAANTATGSFASVSWLIGKERLIIMWSVPYSHDWNNNWLAIGMKSSHTRDNTKTVLLVLHVLAYDKLCDLDIQDLINNPSRT